MANFRAVSATSEALAGLIRDRYPRDEFGTGLGVEIYLPRHFDLPMAEGFSVCLLRVAINGGVRNLTYRRDPDGRRFRPSLPLDLLYLITPWAKEGGTQHRMLGWVMRMFEDLGTLSSSHLNHYVAEPDIFAPNESLDLICDPLALNDYLTLWDRLKFLPPSATYAVRMVMLDSQTSMVEGPPVQTRSFAMGEVAA
jgi:hypothetical protein